MEHPEAPPGFDVFSANCPSREVMQHITGRWGALTLVALVDGPLRFSAVRRRVEGISDRLLAQTLQRLEADGLVLRHDLQSVPPHVEYALSDSGARVTPKLVELIAALQAVMPEVLAERG